MNRRGALLLSLALFLVPACRHGGRPSPPTPFPTIDDLGNRLALQQPARRIVSMAPSITETLFALGLDSVIVGVTDYCDFPPQARAKQRIGGIANPNLEQITALRPDLVVMSVAGNIRGDYVKLHALGFQIFVTNPTSVRGVFKSIEDLGALAGAGDRATVLVSRLRERYDSLVSVAMRFRPKSLLLLISLRPIVAVAPGTFLGELLTLANGINVVDAGPTQYPMVSREEVLLRQPEIILVTNDIARSPQEVVEAYPEWKKLAAAREKRIRLVDANVIARPGPRIMDGLQQLVEAIHGPIR